MYMTNCYQVKWYSKYATYLCWARPKASSNLDLQSWQTKSPILLSILANFSFASSVTSTTLYSGSMSPKTCYIQVSEFSRYIIDDSIFFLDSSKNLVHSFYLFGTLVFPHHQLILVSRFLTLENFCPHQK